MASQTPSLPPGFRFHPTDEELIVYYLKNRAVSASCPAPIIAEVDIYKFDPWELPGKAMFGDKEWYFFSPRDRKYPNGTRPNRAAASGYWKATGTDKPVVAGRGNESIGVKKALVFHKGKPPRGIKTDWIMHEYRLSDSSNRSAVRPVNPGNSSMRLDDWVLCRIYQKSSGNQADGSAATKSPSSNLRSLEQANDLIVRKSFTLSELLNAADFSLLARFLEAPVESSMPVSDKESFGLSNLDLPFINAHQFSETGSSFSAAAGSSLKRQGIAGDQGMGLLQPPKRQNSNSWVYTSFTNQFDSQTFCSQQLLLNSLLGMQ